MKTIVLSMIVFIGFSAQASWLKCQSSEIHQTAAQITAEDKATCPSGFKIELSLDVVCFRAPCLPVQQSACVVSHMAIQPGKYQTCGSFFPRWNIFVLTSAQNSVID